MRISDWSSDVCSSDLLRGAPPHLLEIEHIGWTAQVLRRPFRKGAEAAFVKADIGVIDIAVDDVGHRIANHLPPQFVGRTGDECNVGSVDRKSTRLNSSH